MKYAHEVMDLMMAYPGRHFRMAQLVRHVDPHAVGSVRQRVRNGVLRVLESLDEHGSIDIEPAEGRGSFATYSWRLSPRIDHKCVKLSISSG